MARISTHFSLARLLREHSHHDTPPRSLQGHPHHDHGEQKADGTSGRESPDLNPRLGEEATPLRLNVQTTERQDPSFLEVECTKASDSAGGRTSPRQHDAPEAGTSSGRGLPAHMCGVGEGSTPPGPNALIPQWEGACSPEVEHTKARDLGPIPVHTARTAALDSPEHGRASPPLLIQLARGVSPTAPDGAAAGSDALSSTPAARGPKGRPSPTSVTSGDASRSPSVARGTKTTALSATYARQSGGVDTQASRRPLEYP